MPTTANFDFDYETPSTLPGITITGGPSGASPILAVQVDEALTVVLNSVNDSMADIAALQTAVTGMAPVYARVTLSGTQTLTSNTTTIIRANSVTYQSETLWDAVNFRFQIPAGRGGLYAITASVAYDSNSTGRRSCDIESNYGRLASSLAPTSTTVANVRYTAATQYLLVPGDTVWFTGFQQSGVDLAVEGNITQITHLGIVRVSPTA